MSRTHHHPNHPSVDQSDRTVPRNLRQTGGADVDLLISTRVREWAPDFWLISDPETGEECGYLTSVWWNPELETNIGLGYVPAEKLQAATDVPLDDSIYDVDIDVEFDVQLPDEYAGNAGEPVYATVATVPFKESVNPSAREQAKIHARDDTDE
jgi:aminomethyltransferase